MNQSEQINELAAALSKAQATITGAEMDANNPFFNSKYASLGSVIEAARQPLSENGLSVTQLVSTQPGSSNIRYETNDRGKTLEMGRDHTPGTVTITTQLMHSSGQYIRSSSTFEVLPEKGRSLVQSAGAIITYMRRYALAGALGIYADEDTDGNQPGNGTPKAPPTQIASPSQAPARPYTPEQIKKGIKAKGESDQYKGRKASQAQRGLVVGLLNGAINPGDGSLDVTVVRHAVQEFIWGCESANDATDPQILATLDWLDASKDDDGGKYNPSPMATAELKHMVAEVGIK